MWPEPKDVALPRLLDPAPMIVRGYPLAMVLAEKIVTAVDRGSANTRWRDFADLFLLAGNRIVHGNEAIRAVETVAAFRRARRTPLATVLDGYSSIAQARWSAWRRGQGLEERLPEDFSAVRDRVVRLADPLLAAEVKSWSWDPTIARWIVPGDGEE